MPFRLLAEILARATVFGAVTTLDMKIELATDRDVSVKVTG